MCYFVQKVFHVVMLKLQTYVIILLREIEIDRDREIDRETGIQNQRERKNREKERLEKERRGKKDQKKKDRVRNIRN